MGSVDHKETWIYKESQVSEVESYDSLSSAFLNRNLLGWEFIETELNSLTPLFLEVMQESLAVHWAWSSGAQILLKSRLINNRCLPSSWLKAQHSENEDHGIWSHHFMGNRWGNSGNSVRLYFEISKITADGDCSHEIKRRLLLGRKVMTNLDSIFKSRNITLPTKAHLVKAIVFPVVMYGCESRTVKKAECRRIDAFELWCWRRLLRVPWTARRSNQSILKEISPGCLWKEWC